MLLWSGFIINKWHGYINKQNKWINEENKNSKQFYNLLQIGRKKGIRKLQATLFYHLHKTKWREQWKIVKEKQAQQC